MVLQPLRRLRETIVLGRQPRGVQVARTVLTVVAACRVPTALASRVKATPLRSIVAGTKEKPSTSVSSPLMPRLGGTSLSVLRPKPKLTERNAV